MSGILILAFALLLAIAPAGAAASKEKDPDAIGSRDVSKGVNFYSLEKEIALGQEMAKDVERESKIVTDPVVSEYVNRLVQNLARNSDAKVPFTAKVIDSDEVNAFALPGGFTFVDTGLILRAGSEAELAGVLAHEIAHVAARHGTRQATRGTLVNIASVPMIFAGGWAGYAIQQAASLAVPMTFLRFSRGFEQEADMLGLQYMYHAGYDPTAMVDFFERLESMEKRRPGMLSKLFSTHPMTDDRIRAAQKEIQTTFKPLPEYVVTTSEFEAVQARLKRLENVDHRKDSDPNRPTLRRPGAPGRIERDEDDAPPKLKRKVEQDVTGGAA